VKLYIATPNQNRQIFDAHMCSVIALAKDDRFNLAFPWTGPYDIVRVRCRLAWLFLQTDGTHLLQVDSDVSFTPETVEGMIAADKPIVCAPYPFKQIKRWGAEETAYDYPFQIDTDATIDDTGCVSVKAVPMGMTLIKREVLAAVSATAPCFKDDIGLLPYIYNLKQDDNLEVPEEGYSLCRRAAELGHASYAYMLGTVSHWGVHEFRSNPLSLLTNIAPPPTSRP